MGKNKKRQEKHAVPKPPAQTAAEPEHAESAAGGVGGLEPALLPASAATAVSAPSAAPAAGTPPARHRLRRGLPDLIKVTLAVAVVSMAAAIWYQPPLTLTDFPYVSYQFQGQLFTDAQLLRPLAMPTRYYVRLPKKLSDRYEWFAVDRRREVVALTLAPRHHFLGLDAIKRSDPLGLDLEFRKLDQSEWQVHFLADAIVFSNAVLTVRIDTQPASPPSPPPL